MGTQLGYWIAAGVALFVLIIAAVAEHKRSRRRNLDETGWVPWRGLQMAAMFGFVTALMLAFTK